MEWSLKDRVAVVTGGSSGIGLATAEALLEEGAKVTICGRDQARLDRVSEDLSGRHGSERVLAVACDVLDPAQVEALRDTVVGRFGGTDILVNNAGQARQSTFETTSDQDWRDELELKFFSLIHPTRTFLPQLTESDAASVVCVNALLSRQPESFLLATSAARSGALNLMKGMSLEFAPKGIRVNGILIGIIDSGQWQRRYDAQKPDIPYDAWTRNLAADRKIPLGRFGRPEEAAAAIVFLASSLSSYVTGTTIDVSGGHAKYV